MAEDKDTPPKKSNFMLWLTIAFTMVLMWWWLNR